eukprot:jgi/Chlat1/2622/Chrsp178S02465
MSVRRLLGLHSRLRCSSAAASAAATHWRYQQQFTSFTQQPPVLGPADHTWKQQWRGHKGHAHHHAHSHGVKQEEGETKDEAAERVTVLGFWADMALTVAKATAGYLSGSSAIIADAAHSISDLVTDAVAVWTLRIARAPRDKEYPYGHGRFETIGTLGISTLLIVTAGGIAYEAWEAFQARVLYWPPEGGPPQHNHMNAALAAAALSIVTKEALYRVTRRVAQSSNSSFLMANAWHHRSDSVSSMVALVGIAGWMIGFPWLDPIAGIAVSALIVKAGAELGYESLRELADVGQPESVLTPIRQTALSVPGVQGCHKLRARKMGPYLMCDMHIEVHPWLSVNGAHDIAHAVSRAIRKQHEEVQEALVHIDPGSIELLEPNSSNAGVGGEQQYGVLEVTIARAVNAFPRVDGISRVIFHPVKDAHGVIVRADITLPSDQHMSDAMHTAERLQQALEAIEGVSSAHIYAKLSPGNEVLQVNGRKYPEDRDTLAEQSH